MMLTGRMTGIARRAFTLTELAIVLGIVGIVSAAIWTAVANVNQRQRIEEAIDISNEIARNLRNLYTGHPGAVPPGSLAAQIGANLFPPKIVDTAAGTTRNPWNDQVLLSFKIVGGRIEGFSVRTNLPATVRPDQRRLICASAATTVPGYATDYAGAIDAINPLPAATPRTDANQTGPALTLLHVGGAWKNVTAITALAGPAGTSLFGVNAAQNCDAMAFYYRL